MLIMVCNVLFVGVVVGWLYSRCIGYCVVCDVIFFGDLCMYVVLFFVFLLLCVVYCLVVFLLVVLGL